MQSRHTITTAHFPAVAYSRYGTGPAIMLLHGFPASGNLWYPIAEHLSESYTVLVPDLPGTGDSLLSDASGDISHLASLIPAILDDAGVGKCVIAGHSMGGYVALAAAERYPEKIVGLSLVHSTALADDEEKKEKRRKTITLLRKGAKSEFVRGMIPGLFSETFATEHPEIIEERINDALQVQEEAMIAFYNAMINRPERLEVLRSAAFPVQWILGQEDKTIPWRSCLQQSSLPAVSFIRLYKDCGHMGMIEQKPFMQQDLHKFVAYCQIRLAEGTLR